MARRHSESLGEQSLRCLFDLAINSVYYRHVERHRILLACMPKSGSTFLSNAVARLPGFRKIALTRHYNRVEQEISFSLALRKYKYSYICQQHVRYNACTTEAIETFDLTPVVLVRNIYDCVASVRDHLRSESIETPMAYLLESHLALEDAELETLIVDLLVPWYVNFYVSWMHCPNAMWLTYEDVVANPARAIAAILEQAGAEADDVEITRSLSAVDPSADRKNAGRAGRGQELREESKASIRRYREFYPEIDFSRIGLD